MKASLALLVFGVAAALASPIENNNTEEWTSIPDDLFSMHLVHNAEVKLRQAAKRSDFAVNFYLYTKSNPTTPQMLSTGNISALQNSNFDASLPTRILCHGWRSSYLSEMNPMIRNKCFDRGNFNVIAVDWSDGADTLDYIAAAGNTMPAGHKLGAFVNFLVASGGLDTFNTYLIGHSLGAHVVGFAGKTVNGSKINTIYGLDAALPLFPISAPTKRLAKGDGLYVESIHTDGGVFGIEKPIGDASFYPNYGSDQPGCRLNLTINCSHARSYIYFAESLNTVDQFLATQCSDYNEVVNKNCSTRGPTARMGGQPSNYGRGISGLYYLPVNSQSPYATGSV